MLLRRYGVVLRELTVREALAPPWRHLWSLRRMEARGEIRGGRFDVGAHRRAVRPAGSGRGAACDAAAAGRGGIVMIAAADPLNLVGILTPGARVPATSGQVIAFQRGVPIGVRRSSARCGTVCRATRRVLDGRLRAAGQPRAARTRATNTRPRASRGRPTAPA